MPRKYLSVAAIRHRQPIQLFFDRHLHLNVHLAQLLNHSGGLCVARVGQDGV
jgi:hypothetical protein